MTSQAKSMYMSSVAGLLEALMGPITEILTGSLKDKSAQKAITALQTDEAQETLKQVIKDKMPTKTVMNVEKRGGKRKGKPADKNAPKRNLNAYMYFSKDKRKQVTDENKDLKATEVMKELGRLWNTEYKGTKKSEKYNKLAENDKERYKEAMKTYEPSTEFKAELEEWKSVSSDSDGGKKKRKCKSGPKRAVGAYMYFSAEMRPKVKADNEDMDSKEVSAETGRLWREEYKNDEKKSKKYYKLEKKDKERYDQEKIDWVVPDPTSDDEKKVTPVAKKSSKKKTEKSSKKKTEKSSNTPVDDSDSELSTPPKKRSKKISKKISKGKSFVVFAQETLPQLQEEYNDWDMKMITKEIERLWALMDNEERATYITL